MMTARERLEHAIAELTRWATSDDFPPWHAGYLSTVIDAARSTLPQPEPAEGDRRLHTYTVRTWDTDAQAYTPQAGLSLPWHGLSLWQLRVALWELRRMGYATHRYRDADGSHDDNDWCVLIERDDEVTDGRR